LTPCPHEVERFRREARLAGNLRHANVVSVHEVGESGWFHNLTSLCLCGAAEQDLAPALRRARGRGKWRSGRAAEAARAEMPRESGLSSGVRGRSSRNRTADGRRRSALSADLRFWGEGDNFVRATIGEITVLCACLAMTVPGLRK
jgi:hypothetical protein